MNFSEIENIEKQAATRVQRDYYPLMFEDYIAKEQQKKDAQKNPFDYFCENVIDDRISYDFRSVLGDAAYEHASKDAQNCLSICKEFQRLSAHGLTEWLQNALKFVDNIVLHYIRDICKESPQQYDSMGIEESLYKQLSEKSGDIADAGKALMTLYNILNQCDYRIKICPDETRELISLSKNPKRQTIMKLYPAALKMMLKMYKEIEK
jgi:hypothetical protein